MSHSEPLSAKSYILTIFTAIVVVFVFLMLIKLWHGNNYPNSPEKNVTVEVRSDV